MTTFENLNTAPVDVWTTQERCPQAHRSNNNRPEQNRNCVTYVVGLNCYLCRRLLNRILRCDPGEGTFRENERVERPLTRSLRGVYHRAALRADPLAPASTSPLREEVTFSRVSAGDHPSRLLLPAPCAN